MSFIFPLPGKMRIPASEISPTKERSLKLSGTKILLCTLGAIYDAIPFYDHTFLSISGGTVILASLLVRV